MIKLRVTIACVLLTTISWAQQNVFLSNQFWKSKPTLAAVKEKVKEGTDVLEMNARSFDATASAILGGASVDIIDYFTSLPEVPIDRRTHDGRTYLIWAAYTGNYEVVKMLLEKGADVHMKGTHGYNAFNFAALAGCSNKDLYKLLLENGTDIHITDNHGANAILLIMSGLKDISLIPFLESNGLSLSDKDEAGNGVFSYAARGSNMEVMKYLIDRKVTYKAINKEGGNAALFAAVGTRRGTPSLEIFKFLDSIGIPLNIVDNEGNSPLLVISGRTKEADLIAYFIEKGMNVNQVNKEGNTALLNASSRGTLEIVKLLAEKVKDIDHKNAEGVTALLNAVQYNSVEVVSFLLSNGASINTIDENGNSVLYYWVNAFSGRQSEKHFDAHKLSILTQSGFDITKSQANGNNLFHLAVETENMALLEKSVALNIPINTKNKEGYTPLLKAALTAKNTNILTFLVNHGADKKSMTDFDETAYDLASENELLTKQKASLEFLK